jgi:Fe-S-cluster containining protein
LSDLDLVISGGIPISALFAIRAGEPVYDNIKGRIAPAAVELVKLKERGRAQGCVFLAEKENLCLLYENRPVQCRAFKCWDDEEFKRSFVEQKLSRWDVVDDVRMLALMEEHERRCGYELLKDNLSDIKDKGDEAVRAVLDQVRFDHHIRTFAAQKLLKSPEEMDFFFGRPLFETIEIYGLQVKMRMDGSYLLTLLKEEDGIRPGP